MLHWLAHQGLNRGPPESECLLFELKNQLSVSVAVSDSYGSAQRALYNDTLTRGLHIYTLAQFKKETKLKEGSDPEPAHG